MTRTRTQIMFSYIALALALGFIAIASVLAPANKADVVGAATYYSQYYDDGANTWMCYICPDTSGGGYCGDGSCGLNEDANNCSADCQGMSRENSASNLAQAYDEFGYHPGSACSNGAWMQCPGQDSPPPELCVPNCGSAVCGEPDGCGGTCGSQCNSGCPNAGNTSICPVFVCPQPTRNVEQRTADSNNFICGVQYGWNGSDYELAHTPGTVPYYQDVNPAYTSAQWYCQSDYTISVDSVSRNLSGYPINLQNPSSGSVDCTTLPGFAGYKASLEVVDWTQQIFTGTEDVFWSVAMGWSKTPYNDPVSGAANATGCLNWAGTGGSAQERADRREHCRQIYSLYYCKLVTNNEWNDPARPWALCGGSNGAMTIGGNFQRWYIISGPLRNAAGDPFDSQIHEAENPYSEIPLYTYGKPGSVTSAVPAPPSDLMITGFIPLSKHVYRRSVCDVFGSWYPSGDYGNCATPNPRVAYNTSVSCPDGTAGVTTDITYYNRYDGGGLSALRTDSYSTWPRAKCFPSPTNLTATPGGINSGEISLSWTPYSDYSTIIKEGNTTVCGPTGGTSCTVSNLAPNSTHTFTARVYDSSNVSINGMTVNTGLTTSHSDYNDNSGVSDYGTVFYNYPTGAPVLGAPISISATAPDTDHPPGNIENFSASPSSCGTKTINLSWSASSGATVYRLRRDGVDIYYNSGTSYTDEVGDENVSHTYQLNGSNAFGNSSVITTTATSPQTCYPTTPTNFTATPSNVCSSKSITLSWGASDYATVYRLRRNGTDIYYNNTTSYTDIVPDANTSYTYQLNSSNAISSSNVVTASATSPQICAPTATGFTATAPITSPACGNNWVNISWTHNNEATNYKIYRDGTKIYDGDGIASYNGITPEFTAGSPGYHAFSDAGLTPTSSHQYTMTLTNVGGSTTANASPSFPVTVQPICAPGGPSGLSATANSQTQITLNWADNSSNESGFEVQRSTDNNTWTTITTTAANATSYANTSLSSNTTYYYRVRGVNAGGNSSYSNTASALTPPYPPTPTGFTATTPTNPSCGLTHINIAFYNTNADTYVVKRDGTTVSTFQNGSISWQPDGSSQYYAFSDTGRTPNASHVYTLVYTNAGGSSTATANPSNPAVVQQICVASAPSGITATTNSQTQITVAWVDNSSTETGFKVQRSPNGSSGWTTITTTAANATSYPDTGLTANTTYYYRVLSTNAGGDSSPSSTASATTLPNAPAAPANFVATPAACGTGNMTLSWTASSGATSYTLKRGTTTIYTGSGTSFGDTSLTANTNYSYTVTASNAGGVSAAASVAGTAPPNCTTLTFTAAAPSVKNGGSTTLTWTPANATSCTASGGWNGNKNASGGSQPTGNLSTTTTFTLSCTGQSGTVQQSVVVNVVPAATIHVNSNVQSAGWTISANNTSEVFTGNGNGVANQIAPDLNGTTYTLAPANISGYDFPPSITNSLGGGSSILLFGGENRTFTINYVRSFNYSLSNGGNVTVEKGGINQYGQVTITETLTPDSGPTKPVSLIVTQSDGSPLPAGVSAVFSSCSPGGQPNCTSTLTFTVTPQATAGTYPLKVTGSPLGKTTTFNLTIVNSPDMVVSCTHSPLTAKVGDTVTWSVNVTQTPSRAPYTYIWSGDNIPDGTTAQSFDIVYTTTGTKNADVTVRDSLENIAHCGVEGTINISVSPQFQEF